jgi:hypothetical protein
MKKALIMCALVFSFSNAFAQELSESTSATTMSPFATATELMKSATVTIVSPFATTSATIQSRGVAGKEQLKDELVALNDDMMAGAVKSLDQVRQPALKELFAEIEASDEQMAEINAVVGVGSKLHRIATAVTVELMAE